MPAQAFTAGSVRYTVESVAVGPTIPEINQPSSPFGGDWLAVIVTAENWGEGDATIDMTQFTASVGVDGETRRLDSFSETISIQLGFPEVVGATGEVVLGPDQSIRLGLLFLTAEDASGFVLNAGTTSIDLSDAIETSPPMDALDEAPSAPDLVEATVVGVIDPVTIEVEIDGEVVPVRYTGTSAPERDDCSFDQALDANRDLITGQTVFLERQNTNAAADGAWLRDVWIESEDGALELVSGVLVAAGAVDVAIEEPDSRYAGYLTSLAAIAEEDGVGIWAGC